MDFMKPYKGEVELDTQLKPCPYCNRKFKSSSLEKHANICNKLSKKRKVFDSAKQRCVGTALAEFVPRIEEWKSPSNDPVIIAEPAKVATAPKPDAVLDKKPPIETSKKFDIPISIKCVMPKV